MPTQAKDRAMECAEVGELIEHRGYEVTCIVCGAKETLQRNDSFICECGTKYKLRVVACASYQVDDNVHLQIPVWKDGEWVSGINADEGKG